MINLNTVKNEKNDIIKVRKFEEIVKFAKIIYYNNTHIEIPGVVIFVKKKGLICQMLNPGVEVLQVEEDKFQKMLDFIAASFEEDHIYDIKTKTSPVSNARLNMELIASDLVLLRETEDNLLLNKILFTTSNLEYQGSGLFSDKEVFLVDAKTFAKVCNFIELKISKNS